VIDSLGYTGAYWIGAGVALVSAGFVLLLRQPQTPPAAPQAAVAAREERRPLATRELATAGTGGD
jgi:hypothetical protein